MPERTVIEEVREAKRWLDTQNGTLAEHVKYLRQIEREYAERSGDFQGVPLELSPAVRALIEAAADEPGGALLRETRPAKTA